MMNRKCCAAALAVQVLALSTHALAAGDAMAGKAQYEARCAGCHSVDENRVGPAHRDVVGRLAATQPGFNYSAALRSSSIVWNEKTLDAWLADPEGLVSGQAMFVRVEDPEARRDIIAYLATLRSSKSAATAPQ